MAKTAIGSLNSLLGACAIAVALVAAVVSPADAVIKKKKKAGGSVIVGLVSPAPDESPRKSNGFAPRKKAAAQDSHSTIQGMGGGGAATTKTEILAGQNVAPMLALESGAAMRQAEEQYASIVSSGGWPQIGKASLKKGSEGDAVAVLNKRLFIEGYLRREATEGEFATVFTSATEDALSRFQKNHGLAATGRTDGPTLAALNVPAAVRLQTIRANIPRLDIYGAGLGDRYLVVNIPGQQIEAISGTQVYSRHNAIVGRPERPTPVVMTDLSMVKFNPYWNAPASIIERDIIPRIQKGGTRVLDEMDITVFRGFGGPEIDPDTVDWDYAVADDFHFRQEPGPHNAMATAKIEFESPFGIYLHDTPEKQLFRSGKRFYSSGCVRVEQVDVLLNWILNGQDGYNSARIASMAETLERTDVPLVAPPQLRVVYLTAWPTGNTVAFRDDVYGLDRTGFTVGQPLPVGETLNGLRYTLKPIPRLVAASDGDGGFFGRAFGKSAQGRAKGKSFFDNLEEDNGRFGRRSEEPTKSVIVGLNGSGNTTKVKPKPGAKADKKQAKAAKKETGEETKSVIVGLNGGDKSKVAAKSSKQAKATKDGKGSKTAVAKKADAKAVATTDKAAKPSAKAKATGNACKPDAAGKLPAGCAAKAKPKTKEPQTAAN